MTNKSILAFLAAGALCGPVFAQQKPQRSESLANLELTSEIAATDNDGYPSAIRITIKNVGGVAVDMPLLKQNCGPDNGIHVEAHWIPDNPLGQGFGSGYGCGGSSPTLLYRVTHEWVRLRPGEYMVDTERVQWSTYEDQGPGTIEYWVEYTPPAATAEEVASVLQAGYILPTEKLETQHSSFRIN